MDINRYAYALNDPVNLSDPNGHSTWVAPDGVAVHIPDGEPGIPGYDYDPIRNYPTTIAMAAGFGGTVAAVAAGPAIVTSSVWALPPVVRGARIEKLFGGNLPKNFPVIDKVKNFVATSIKSIDVKSKTFQNTKTFQAKVKSYIDKVADFKGATFNKKQVIQGVQFNKKTLELVVNKKSLSSGQNSALKSLKQYAKDNGVKLTIKNAK